MSETSRIDRTTNSTVTRKIIKHIYALFKYILSIIKRYKVIAIVSGIIIFIAGTIAIIMFLKNLKTEKSYEGSILHEIQYARDILGYTLILRQLNIRSRPTFSLEYLNHLPKSFSDSPSLKSDLADLYQSLSSAKKSTEDLLSLLPQNNSDPLTITNRDKDIEKAVNMADNIGPQVARHIGKTWQTPDPNMSLQEKKEYYEKKTWVLNSTATDTNINSLWLKNK